MEYRIETDRIVLEGNGTKFLKQKALLVDRLGSEFVAFEGSSKVSVPLELLSLIVDLLEINASRNVLEQLNPILSSFEQHETARESFNYLIENGGPLTDSEHWNRILDPLQLLGVSAMVLPNLLGMCLFDEQGSGKTIMTIAAFDILFDLGLADLLIVVSPKTMVLEWNQEISKFLGSKYKVEVLKGSYADKLNSFQRKAQVYVGNFEAFQNIESVVSNICANHKTLLVVDESYYIKNSESLRSITIRKMRRNCFRAFVLCGTPAPNGPEDVIHQFDIADNGFAFRGFRLSGDPNVDSDRIRELTLLRGVFLRRLKTEMFPGLGAKEFHIESVTLDDRQRQLYQTARDEMELWLRGMDNVAFRRNLGGYFARRQTLLQICSCPEIIDPLYSNVCPKLIALDELIIRLVIERQQKVVIWSYFRYTIEVIQARYSHHGIARIDGSVSDGARREAVQLFQNDPNTMIFLGNASAAGAGITLHRASHAIYYSFSNQAANYLQSLDRIHRRGQQAAEVNYYFIVSKNTIEGNELIRLRNKELAQQDLLGDVVSFPSSIDDALEDIKMQF